MYDYNCPDCNEAKLQSDKNARKINEVINQVNQIIDNQYTTIEYLLDKADEIVGETAEIKVNEELGDINTEIYNINSAIEVERNRINNLTTLPQGSTVGDAELIDGRVGNNGIVYQNIGDAIRNQINNVIGGKKITYNKTLLTGDGNITILLEESFIKGQNIEITLQDTNNILITGKTIYLALIDNSGVAHDKVITMVPNIKYNITAEYDIKSFKIWLATGITGTDGEISILINSEKNTFETINYTLNELVEVKNDIDNVLRYVFGSSIEYTNLNKITYEISNNNDLSVVVPYDLQQNKQVNLILKDENKIINDTAFISLACVYNTGTVNNVIKFKPNTVTTFNPTENGTAIKIWLGKNNITKSGNVIFEYGDIRDINLRNYIKEVELKAANNEVKINDLSLNAVKKHTFAILGDSYSTYEGWLPSGFAPWYKSNGNEKENNVSCVNETWWYKLCETKNFSLLKNISYSGTTICNTGYSGSDYSSKSFITRMKAHLGESNVLDVKPDIIFILGGTNDSWADSPIGENKYTSFNDDDLKSVLPSTCYMLSYLKQWNPSSRIIMLLNDGSIKNEIIDGMVASCEHYNVEYIKLGAISLTSGHPNVDGMKEIKNKIIKYMISNV